MPLLFVSALWIPSVADAQETVVEPAPKAAPAAPADDTVYADDIVVTAQALPGAVIGDIPPENQIGPAEISSYGVDTISDLLAQISDQTASIAGRDDTSGPVVLVNGKRVSGVNEIGDLPVESVLRVDILPEEVAIKYGYDAQQKVVNIILRRRFQSRVVDLASGLSEHGDGEQGTGGFTYTKIHDNNRLNVTGKVSAKGAILESDRDIAPDPDNGIASAGGIDSEAPYRTLQSSTRNYALGVTYARPLGDKANASFNVKGNYSTSKGLDGLATGTLAIPADSPFSDGDDTTLTRYLSADALRQSSDNGSLSAGGSVNVDLSQRWKLSIVGNYQHSESTSHSDTGYDLGAVQSAIDAGAPTLDPYGVLPAGQLGGLLTSLARSNNDSGSASILAMGKLFKLPAGDISTSIKLGGDFTAQNSTAIRDGITTTGDASRTDGSARVSLDLPLTSRSKRVVGALGTLSLNFNGGVTQVSDFGALGTFGYGLNWTPITGVTLIAAVNEDRSAPGVSQLSDPLVSRANQRVYDYVTGQSVLVTTLTGGNPNLKGDDRHAFKLGLDAAILSQPKLNFSASYVDSRNRDVIRSLGGVTEAVEDAFPDRFTRDDDGTLTQIDSRPVNIYEQRSEQIRWGFNLSAQLRKPVRPAPPPGGWGGARRDGQGGEGRRAGEGRDGRSEGAEVAPAPEGEAAPPPPAAGNEIVVNGERQEAPERFGGPPGGFPPDGFGDGPPPGEFREGGRGGEGGFGGPGGSGGPGGRGRGGRGMGGSDNGMRLNFSLYHTWILRQTVQLTADSTPIDLLHGGTLGGGATPQHKITADLGITDNGVGVQLQGDWQSATDVTGSSLASGDLHFDSLATLDLRLFINLQNRFRRKAWARGTRVSLSVDNLVGGYQHVTDANGLTPYAYQRDLANPMGRTLMLTVRRIF
ncbi:MAG: TonB-dependent receptor [Candidatus Andeanibacterium colombiense]|uniref:TonB-dependent receptor n=1 Tax=Candidatus Andeanibacterium colombiense TaxID=3121345 RepID=A0AAJ5X6K6_9SPHN|nr:MAG: TonB-dependent receptor [Sphingomonadaceae bacterium]